jgi:hypothetical protein
MEGESNRFDASSTGIWAGVVVAAIFIAALLLYLGPWNARVASNSSPGTTVGTANHPAAPAPAPAPATPAAPTKTH